MDLVLQLYDVALRVIQKKTIGGYLHRFAVLAEQLNDGEKVLKVKKYVRNVNGLSTLFKPLHVSRFIVAYSCREAATQCEGLSSGVFLAVVAHSAWTRSRHPRLVLGGKNPVHSGPTR